MSDWRQELARRFAPLGAEGQPAVPSLDEQHALRERFYCTVAAPALRELKTELEHYGRAVDVRTDEHSVAEMTIRAAGREELFYAVQVQLASTGPVAFADIRFGGAGSGLVSMVRHMGSAKPLTMVTCDDIIQNFLIHYRPPRPGVAADDPGQNDATT